MSSKSANATSRIRGFLIMKPKPARVVVHCDDQEQEVALGRSYAKTADTLAALDFDRVECFDSAGKLLRALEGDDAKRDEVELPEVLKQDPMAAAFAYYAERLADAYRHSTDVAFTKMVEVFDISAARQEATDRRLERVEAENRGLVRDQIDAELDRAEEQAEEIASGGGFERAMGNAFFGGQAFGGQQQRQQQPAQQRATNGKTNGKHTSGQKPKADA